MFKKGLRTLVFLLLLLSVTSMTVSAKSVGEDAQVSLSDVVDLESSEVEFGEILTFDEMAKVYVETFGLTLEQAEERLLEGSVIRSEDGEVIPSSLASDAEIQALAYRTLSTTLNVTTLYKPKLEYYSQVDIVPGSSFRAIVTILDVNLDRSSNGLSKQFDGKIFTHLENANRIKYTVNGDWYNNGNMTFNGSVNIKVGRFATVTFGVSGGTNHYKYTNLTGHYNY